MKHTVIENKKKDSPKICVWIGDQSLVAKKERSHRGESLQRNCGATSVGEERGLTRLQYNLV